MTNGRPDNNPQVGLVTHLGRQRSTPGAATPHRHQGRQPPHPARPSRKRFVGRSELVVDSNDRIIIQVDTRLLQLGQPQLAATRPNANVPSALARALQDVTGNWSQAASAPFAPPPPSVAIVPTSSSRLPSITLSAAFAP